MAWLWFPLFWVPIFSGIKKVKYDRTISYEECEEIDCISTAPWGKARGPAPKPSRLESELFLLTSWKGEKRQWGRRKRAITISLVSRRKSLKEGKARWNGARHSPIFPAFSVTVWTVNSALYTKKKALSSITSRKERKKEVRGKRSLEKREKKTQDKLKDKETNVISLSVFTGVFLPSWVSKENSSTY